jgi:hypothetical protein
MRKIKHPDDDVREMTWRLIDEQLEAPQFNRLESRLRESESARTAYVECMWLHSELLWHFRAVNGVATSFKFVDDPLLKELLASQSPAPLPKKKPSRLNKALKALSLLF